MVNKFVVTELKRDGDSVFVVSFIDATRTTVAICGFADSSQATKIAEGLNRSLTPVLASCSEALETANSRIGAVEAVMGRYRHVEHPDGSTVMRELRQAMR